MHLAGGFAERVAVPAAALHDIPDEMTLGDRRAHRAPGQRRARLAAGRAARGRASRRDRGRCHRPREPARRRRTSSWARSRSSTVPASDSTLADRLGAAVCAEELDGEYDVVVDAVGSAQTRASAVEHVRPGGTSVWLGLAEAEAGFDGNGLVRGEKRVVGSFAYSPEDFADAVRLASSLDLGWATAIDDGGLPADLHGAGRRRAGPGQGRDPVVSVLTRGRRPRPRRRRPVRRALLGRRHEDPRLGRHPGRGR